ncbi:transcriptional regulator CynR [Streptomyces sp. NPDC051563]|uniref:transcriptional regulator CynR n=1 Tax=Streptomyces sp. NPDC051563 TaxID=3365659 RepID=UPI0037A1B914
MALELRHLRYLLAVAEHAGFTRAAEELRISQPTLSQQIKQLENTIGVQLLDRTGRNGVRLTDAGETYARYARRALRDLAAAERAVHDLADLSRGHLRLAVTPTFTAYLVGPLAAELHARHPGVTLDVKDMAQDRIEAGLLADELDLGIAFAGPHLPGISASPLYAETLSLVTAAADSAAADSAAADNAVPAARPLPPLPVTALVDRQLALLSGDFATRGHIDAYLEGHRVRPRIAVEANSVQTLTEIVRRTDLATVLPDAITEDHPHLAPLALEPPLPTRTVALLRRENAYRSAAGRAFTRLTRRHVLARGYTPA